MRRIPAIVGGIVLSMSATAFAADPGEKAAVWKPVEAFYAAFDHGFVGSADFATEDWTHINPFGGWTRGRDKVLEEVRGVHSTFLKGVRDTVRESEVRFAGADSAIVTVVSTMSRYVTPDGAVHDDERHIRTFVVVRRGGRWLVMQDQNTTVRPLP